MFDPTEFLAVARALVGNSGSSGVSPVARAGRVRTVYGRVYYALYLLVRSELERRHRINPRKLQHGAVYSKLQSSRADAEVRHLGRELQRLYTLRQKADYELVPLHGWQRQMEDERAASKLINLAADWAANLHRLDFSSVVPLF